MCKRSVHNNNNNTMMIVTMFIILLKCNYNIHESVCVIKIITQYNHIYVFHRCNRCGWKERTRDMADLKTPPSMAEEATSAYTPGWMFHHGGSACMRCMPTMPPKDAPVCSAPHW